MISKYNQPEVLNFEYKGRHLSKDLIKSREHLVLYLKNLSKKTGTRADKIVFNHDLNDDKYKGELRLNFTKNGTYDYLKEELKTGTPTNNR